MASNLNQRKAGAVLSYVNVALAVVIPFVYTPFMLKILGQASYGLFALAYSVTGYLALLKFGIGGSVIRYLNKCIAKEDKDAEEHMMGAFVKIFLVCSLTVLVAGAFLYAFAGPIFTRANKGGLTGEEVEVLKILVVILTLNTALSFPMSVWESVIMAHQRFVFQKIAGMIETVLSPCLSLLMLFLGFGVVGLTVQTLIMTLFAFGLNYFYTNRKLHLKVKLKNTPKGIVKEILRFSFYLFIASIVDLLYWSTDKILLGAMVSTVAVGIYNIGSQFNNMVSNFSAQLQTIFAPKINNLYFKNNDMSAMNGIFIKVGRIQFLIISLIVGGFTVFGRPFIILWAGKEYEMSYFIAMLVMWPLVVPLIQNTGISICIAKNMHKFRANVYLVIAIFNAVATFLILKFTKLGAIGAAIPTCVGYILGPILAMNIYYYKRVGIDIPAFWKNIFKMLPVSVVMIAGGLVITRFVDFTNNIILFLVSVAVYTLVYAALSWLFVMNRYEKDIFIVPARKIMKKLRGRKSNG